MSHELLQESLDAADEVIALMLKEHQLDYSAHRDQIARELFDDGIYEGNANCTTRLEDPQLPDLRCIQEDEYDQHMDNDDDAPSWDDMIGGVGPGYLWFA